MQMNKGYIVHLVNIVFPAVPDKKELFIANSVASHKVTFAVLVFCVLQIIFISISMLDHPEVSGQEITLLFLKAQSYV